MKRSKACALLLLCLLLPYGLAHAAPTTNLMDFMQAEGVWDTPPMALDRVQTVGITQVVENIALSVEGVYYDGEHLLLGWKTVNLYPENPAMVLYQEVTVGGQPIRAIADFPMARWTPSVFGLLIEEDPVNGLMGGLCAIAEDNEMGWQGETEVSVRFIVKVPQEPVVVVDPAMEAGFDGPETQADHEAMMRKMVAHDVLIAAPDQLDPDAWVENGYFVVNRTGDYYVDGAFQEEGAPSEVEMPGMKRQEAVITFTMLADAPTTMEADTTEPVAAVPMAPDTEAVAPVPDPVAAPEPVASPAPGTEPPELEPEAPEAPAG